MCMKDSYDNTKKVTFDTQNRLEEKISRLTMMMSKLTTKEEGLSNWFKTEIYQSKRRGQNRKIYDRCNYQNSYRSGSGDRRISFRGRIQCGQNRPRYEQNFRRGNFRGSVRMYEFHNPVQNYTFMEETTKMKIMKEVRVSQEKDGYQVKEGI